MRLKTLALVHTSAGIVLPENSTMMKRIKIGSRTMFLNQTKKLLRVSLAALCLLTAHFSLSAQTCTLACAPVNVGIDINSCTATLSIPSIGFASADCTGPYSVIVVNNDLNPLLDTLIFAQQNLSLGDVFNIGALELGQEIDITYFHQPDNNNCTKSILVEDDTPPTFVDCRDTLINCTVGFDAEDPTFFPPDFQDNCFGNQTLNVRRVGLLDCQNTAGFPDSLTQVIVREWVIFDPALPDMRDTCFQQVRLRSVDLADVVFPADTVVDCSNPASPAFAGQPMVNGTNIGVGSIGTCQLSATFTDLDTVANCSANDFFIQREWLITYWCDNTILRDTQLISVKDTVAPMITCPADFTVGTSTQPSDCGAAFLVPFVTATDNCSQFTVTVMSSFGASGFLPYSNVPPGMHTITYTATDECGNANNCSINLTVIDDETPTPVCEEFTTIALPSNGSATVSACVFDANNNCTNPASYDDCSPIAFKASLDNATFTDNLTFTCAQAGMTLNVFLQVSETVNPASATVCMVNVIIEDNEAPAVTCPANMTIDCEDNTTNLSVFGLVSIADNCDFTMTADSTFNVSQCGEGTITRTFTATDGSGNNNSCTQVLTVVNSTPFDGTGINFPANYTETNTCRDPNTLNPEDLNPNYLTDIFPTGGTSCAMLAVSFNDMFFDLNAPSCYKIIRTWRVIDWCQYDADNPATGGIWESAQIIKVMDNTAPVLNVPATIFVSVDENCAFGEVNNLTATATDGCNTSGIVITNSFNSSVNGTAYGMYPFGNTTVIFTANDGCGNTSTAETLVRVVDDKAPTLVCNSNLTTDLANMGPNGMVMANVDLFVYDSYDNCTPTTELKFTMQVADGSTSVIPTTTDLAFTCSDLGDVALEIYSTDASGNAEVCTVTLVIQDNNSICPDESTEVSVAGAIMTEPGDELEEVEVTLISNSNALPDMTSSTGIYNFPNLPPGVDYTVVPERDGNDDNGVTTFDIIQIIRHIQQIQTLDSPYKIIAADVNNTQSVTMADVVLIKRIILNLDSEFAAVNSWKFVDMYYEFQNPTNPWEFGFPEVLQLQNLNENHPAANFTAIKMGDVNGSANVNFTDDEAGERTDKSLVFSAMQQHFSAGETVTIPLHTKDFTNIAGFQTTFSYDAEVLSFEELTGADWTQDALQYNDRTAGEITLAWQQMQGKTLRDASTILTLEFTAKTAGNLRDVLHINDKNLRTEAYRFTDSTDDTETLNIALQFAENMLSETRFALYQNAPNPFRSETRIAFDLPTDTEATLLFFDAAGRRLHERKGDFVAGRNEITISYKDLNTRGLVWYQLSTATHTETRKMSVGF